MLAVWGSPGSGKTTVAVKLAARLAMQKRDVALLLCDMNTPSEHIERVLGSVAFQIPHSEEVKAQVLEGDLLKELGLKDSRGFRKSIEAISKEVFGC